MPNLPAPLPIERHIVIGQRRSLIWEGTGVMCPGAVRLHDQNIGLLYCGAGSNNIGHLGYCVLDPDGRTVIQGRRSRRPINHRGWDERHEFPGGYGNPRVSQVGDVYYIWANGRNNAQLQRNRAQFDNDLTRQY